MSHAQGPVEETAAGQRPAAGTAGRRRTGREILANGLRGALIGTVETMPGVSGGTVALVVMVYERLIASASALIVGVCGLVAGIFRGPERRAAALDRLRGVDWLLLLPLFAGMGVGILVMAHFMEDLAANHPVLMRAAFFGMVLVSLLVPIRLAGRWRRRDWVYMLAATAVAAVAVSLPSQTVTITPVTLMLCAALAVGALALPGLSGSFLLLALGVYEPTLAAVNDRDLGYLGVFLAGALVGGVLIVLALRRLLAVRHHATMVVITGLMAGGLRALWPWQAEDRSIVPADPATLWPVIGLVLAGAAVVGVGVYLERRMIAREAAHSEA
ncbi:DUF368 domain-containing protein [Zhihengliuella sp.]|uniref:DUF368 domain-containing protein n=1 Tax=Zhihengliuella sp. TaxID=1954483 RepID=UPI0028116347|nr:DUF368 domain-containing protein [Zhihengliuella sp.]